MNINPINISFGRVVKIKNSNRNSNSYLQKNNTEDIIRILKNQSVKDYSKEETKRIKDFFKRTLGDYNGSNEIIYRQTEDGHGVIVSGKEATSVLLMEMKQRKGYQKYSRSSEYTEEEKQIFYNKSAEDIDRFLSQRIENGRSKRPLSCYYLSSSTKYGKIDKINYTNAETIYSAEIDGHVLNNEELKNCPYYRLQESGVRYNSESLNINA